MALTPTEREFYGYCDTHELIPTDVLDSFTRKLEQEGNTIAGEVSSRQLPAMRRYRGL